MAAKNILLVESNTDIAVTLQELLESEGYHVAYTSELSILFSNTDFSQYDLIIADIDDNKSANTELSRLRATRQLKTKIFVITSYFVVVREQFYVSMGLDEVITKPIDLDIFLGKVRGLIGLANKG